MIKFFQKIRRKLIKEGKLKSYVLYAIGEIFLVVVGILIALQINNWNESQKADSRATSFLSKLKEDINADIEFITERDGFVAIREATSEKAIEKLYYSRSVKDILMADSLFDYQWNDLRINKSVYEEMLATGSIYTLKNKDLQDKITNYYAFIESHQYYIKSVNDRSEELRRNEALVPFEFLVNSYKYSPMRKIDTTWISDVNSPTFLALFRFFDVTHNSSNVYRRIVFERVLNRSKDLVAELDKELGQLD